MHRHTLNSFAALVLSVGLTFGSACSDGAQSQRRTAAANAPYPAEVSLVDEAPKGWTYRQSPGNYPLYYYDRDAANVSNCYDECTARFIPLPAPASAKPLGEWSVVTRKDGRKQWAYQSHPVYTLLDDSVQSPTGDGAEGVWHLMPHFQ